MPRLEETPLPLRQHMPRRRRGYLLPFLLALIGAILVWQGVTRIVGTMRQDGIRLEAPGQHVFTIEKAGKYRLWLETPTFKGGSSDEVPAGSRIEITQLPDNEAVELRPITGSMRMTLNGVRRVALGTMTSPAAAEYRLVADGTDRHYFLYLDETGAFWKFFTGIAFTVIGGMAATAAVVWAIVVLATASRSPKNLAGC
jgi:hypothetical protein